MSRFPPQRPIGLRTQRATGRWWRIDPQHPDQWTWQPFPAPRHRFDPPSGRFRTRYAANTPIAAARERFPGRYLTAADGQLYLVELTADTPAVHLTHQATLDALGLDDRINTARLDRPGPDGDPLLDISQQLADAIWDWWQPSPPAIVYRTRTTPTARSIAFTQAAGLQPVRARPLADATPLLATLITRHGFTVPTDWLR